MDQTIDRIVYVLDQLERRLCVVEDRLAALAEDGERTNATHATALAKQAETVSRGMLVLYDLLDRSTATRLDKAPPEDHAATLMQQELAALTRRNER